MTTLSYLERASYCQNPLAAKIFRLMAEKKTNLSFNPDLENAEEILELADKIGPYICMLKTHVDIITDFSQKFIHDLVEISKRHQFFLFEDRKFADIGSIVQKQYTKGMYKISSWAHVTNAHIVAGEGTIDALKSSFPCEERGIFLLAQMSSKGSLLKDEYTQKAISIAEKNNKHVIGFICQERLSKEPGFIHFTPGCSISEQGDSLGQQFNSPEYLIKEHGSDILTVGRGIYQSSNPLETAKIYHDRCFSAYESLKLNRV